MIFPSLRFLCCSLLCAPLLVTANPLEQTDVQTAETQTPIVQEQQKSEFTPEAMQKMQVRLSEHLDEWNEMKPALQRLIKSEQDLTLIIAALDKMSPLAAQPSEEQLLEKTTLTLPPKTEKKKPGVVAKKTEKVKPGTALKKTETKVAAVKMPEKAAKKTKSNKRVAIHLASYKKAKNALRGWSLLAHKYSGILKNRKPLSQKVTINNKLYIRLLAGSFASREAAQQTCSALKSQQQYCHVVTY